MSSRRVLITGGARGIGKAIALQYHQSGYDVVTPSREEMDLSSELSIQRFIDSQVGAGYDILINNAAENIVSKLQMLSIEDWKRMQTINLTAPFILQFATKQMIDQQWGRCKYQFCL
ncbi:MAG: SDR family oxidoreductase [Anaerolineales bacterium]